MAVCNERDMRRDLAAVGVILVVLLIMTYSDIKDKLVDSINLSSKESGKNIQSPKLYTGMQAASARETDTNTNKKDLSLESNNLIIASQDDIDQVTNGLKSQADPKVVELLRRRIIYGPSKGPLNLTTKNTDKMDYSQIGQSSLVDGILKQKTGGFFIECGAATGEFLSNTLYFEKKRNWTGLLIEGNPTYFYNVLQKKRNAYAVNAALCAGNATTAYTFYIGQEYGGIDKKFTEAWLKNSPTITVQCFHLYSILLAIRQTKIDYFSLDIEGPELAVLQTIPFDKIYIGVITVEFSYKASAIIQNRRKQQIIDHLTSNGFKLVKQIGKQDLVFQHV